MDNTVTYMTIFSEDFRNEISSNILDEIDDFVINTYFGNLDSIEVGYLDAIKVVETEKLKYPDFVQVVFDTVLEKAHKNYYIRIFEEMTKMRYNAFCQILPMKNPLLTFENPFFTEKAFEMQVSDIKLLERMKK
jgi:hypothetical protein